jgi:hypothetical protein
MAVELRTAGFVDAAGFVSTDGDQIGAFVEDNPASFPTILAHAELLGSIRTQVKVMRAEHAMYSDYAQRNIAFFEQFNPSP